jgi:small subunit ribosomal protein S15
MNNLEGFESKNIIDLGVGSTEYQISSINKRIKMMSNHIQVNKKDYSCKYGLMKLVSKQKKLLKYLKRESLQRYKNIIIFLGLREKK